jgi:hypothetical protein
VTTKQLRTLVYVAVICAIPSLASAQLFETIGIRAQGMAGAFVAVADDASATWWNPAGIASGAFFSGIVERGDARSPRDDATLGVSLVVPSLGLSYYRLRISEPLLVPVGGAPTQSRSLFWESPSPVCRRSWWTNSGRALGSRSATTWWWPRR